MENADYPEFSKILFEHFERTPSSQRAEFTKKSEEVLMKLICRNVREDIPAESICPRCSKTGAAKYGHTVSGKQRYKCADCGRIYTADSRRNLLSNSKLPVKKWLKTADVSSIFTH